MFRREFLTGLAGFGVTVPSIVLSTVPSVVSAQAVFRTVVEVDSADPGQMLSALNIVQETGRYHVAHRESAEIRVIAVGEGVAMVRADTSPVVDRISFIMRSLPIVSWYASAEDVAALAAVTGTPPPLIPEVMLVENGAAEAARLQADGWSLIRP